MGNIEKQIQLIDEFYKETPKEIIDKIFNDAKFINPHRIRKSKPISAKELYDILKSKECKEIGIKTSITNQRYENDLIKVCITFYENISTRLINDIKYAVDKIIIPNHYNYIDDKIFASGKSVRLTIYYNRSKLYY